MNVQEAARPDETVADRLRAARHCYPLLKAVEGLRSWHELTYEDLTRPSKLTGGQVCLRSRYTDGQPDWFWQVRGDRLYGWIGQGPVIEGRQCSRELRRDIEAANVEVRPVVVEDTPFAEDDDG
jgi:hypothetical protein